ncbi:glycosyltransferase [Sphingobacterium corticis]|uniref:Glycosyltransferase n=1 Tax=Sphingobacterium corticis TaxID=1812823 RepID=A0ABW5NJL6_9SPHI
MRILYVIDSLITGGAEKLVVETVPKLIEIGFKVDIALLDGKPYPLLKELEQLDICHIYKLSFGSVYNPILIYKLTKIIKHYSVVHVHLFPAQYWVVIAGWLNTQNTRLIFTEHSTSNRRLKNYFLRILDRLFYKSYEEILCITEAVKDELLKRLQVGVDKLIVLSNGVNIDKIEMAIPVNRVKVFGYSNEDKILIMIGAFRREKDQDTVVRSMNYLPKEFKLVFVGDGVRRKEVETLAEDLNLCKRVKFLGNRSDVGSLLKAADISILSSHWEGFGLAAVESMAAGIPVIGSDVAGLANVIGDAGQLFIPADEKDLVKKIRYITKSTKVYNSFTTAGRIRAQHFSIDNMVDKLSYLYKKYNLSNE